MNTLIAELSGMLEVVESTRSLSTIEAKAKQIVELWSASPPKSPTKRRRLKRFCPEDDDVLDGEDTDASCTTVALGISPLSAYNVVYNGLVFPTMMHAFQAQKANKKLQSKYTTCTLADAAAMGRMEVIDIDAWDANKDSLMLDIMRAYLDQHEHAKLALKDNDLLTLKETSMPDAYWPSRIPEMWRGIKAETVEAEE